MKTVTLAGGCFWCLDAVYRRLRGVEVLRCGYAGGNAETANYDTVSTGMTKHAETVQVTFDESVIPSEVLLDIFFLIHDPTTLNRQGADVGPQYRSAMFYENEADKELYEAAISRASEHWDDPIVTEVVPLEAFYEAEPAHQDYFSQNPSAGYCSVVIAPKIVKVRREYTKWFKESEV